MVGAQATTLLAIFIGGGLGSVARYVISLLISRRITGAFPSAVFPWGTLTVNVLGSFLIGLLMFWSLRRADQLPELLRLGAAVGFCGGFTTFSTFSMELVELLRAGEVLLACVYMAASFVFSMAAFCLADVVLRFLR